MAQHTPREEWTLRIDRPTPEVLHGSVLSAWGTVFDSNGHRLSEGPLEKARLIAAAPALLEALRDSAVFVHSTHSIDRRGRNTFDSCDSAICEANRAAIAAATEEKS
jgi:hypothetical protein